MELPCWLGPISQAEPLGVGEHGSRRLELQDIRCSSATGSPFSGSYSHSVASGVRFIGEDFCVQGVAGVCACLIAAGEMGED